MIKNYETFLKEGRFNPFKKRPANDAVPMLVPGEHSEVDPYGEEEWDENDFSFGYYLRKARFDHNVESVEFCHKNMISLNGIENCANLKRLTLSYNELANLNGIENCVNLEYLNLNNNKLTNFDLLNGLIMLKKLEIEFQTGEEPVTNVNFVRNLINLNALHCKGNMITNLDVIKDLRDLKVLYCCPNNFSEEYAKELKEYCDQNGIANDLKACLNPTGTNNTGKYFKGDYNRRGGWK
jgi:hypothetical protein